MAISPPENVSIDRKRVIGELIHGQDLATQLQTLLRQPLSGQRSVSAEDLVVKILRSFTEALAVLRCYDQYSSGDSGGDGGSAAEGRSCKGAKNRRGCYKRRKNSETRIWVSCTIEDGHAWRKYGQKEILNAKFPRSYYRCTRKHEQGCRAMKQVQRMEGDIIMYHTTYIGRHTCRDIPTAPHFIGGYDPNDHKIGSDQESELKAPEKVQEMKPEVIKEETVMMMISSDISTADNVSSMDSVNLWSGLEALDSYMPAMVSPRRGCSSDIDHDDDTMNNNISRNAAAITTTTAVTTHDMDEQFVLECLDFKSGTDHQFHFDDQSHVQFFLGN